MGYNQVFVETAKLIHKGYFEHAFQLANNFSLSTEQFVIKTETFPVLSLIEHQPVI